MNSFKPLLAALNENPNLMRIFNEIRFLGPIKKSQVGLDLSISQPTRYELIDKLVSMNIVTDTSVKAGGAKRRNSILDVVKDRFYVLGIDIHMLGINIVLMNLKAETVAERFYPNSISTTTRLSEDNKNVVVDRIQNGILEVLHENNINLDSVIACGISDAGLIDQGEGIYRGGALPGRQ